MSYVKWLTNGADERVSEADLIGMISDTDTPTSLREKILSRGWVFEEFFWSLDECCEYEITKHGMRQVNSLSMENAFERFVNSRRVRLMKTHSHSTEITAFKRDVLDPLRSNPSAARNLPLFFLDIYSPELSDERVIESLCRALDVDMSVQYMV